MHGRQALILCVGRQGVEGFGKTVALPAFLYNKDTCRLVSCLLKKFKNYEGTIIKWNQSKKTKTLKEILHRKR